MHQVWADKAVNALFNGDGAASLANAQQFFATRRSELGFAMERFIAEYSQALVAQDVELFWDDQCTNAVYLRCHLSKLGGNPKLVQAAPALAASLKRLSSMKKMVSYSLSLDYWLDVLEAFARRQAPPPARLVHRPPCITLLRDCCP